MGPVLTYVTVVADMGKAFMVIATLSSMLVVVGSLERKNKGWPDWSLIIGAVILTIGLGLTTIVTFDLSDWIERHGRYPCLGAIGLGSVLFAMGFFMDQLRHRSIQKYQAQLASMGEAAAILQQKGANNDG